MPKIMSKPATSPFSSSSPISVVKETSMTAVKAGVGAGTTIVTLGWLGWGVKKLGEGISGAGNFVSSSATFSNATSLASTIALTVPMNKITSFTLKKILGNPKEETVKGQSVRFWSGISAFYLSNLVKKAVLNHIFEYPPEVNHYANYINGLAKTAMKIHNTTTPIPVPNLPPYPTCSLLPSLPQESYFYTYMLPVLGLVALQALTIYNHRLQKSINREEYAQLEPMVEDLSKKIQNIPADQITLEFIKESHGLIKEMTEMCEKLKKDPDLTAKVALIEKTLDKCLEEITQLANKLNFEGPFKELEDDCVTLRLLKNSPESAKNFGVVCLKTFGNVQSLEQALKDVKDSSLQGRFSKLKTDIQQILAEHLTASLNIQG